MLKYFLYIISLFCCFSSSLKGQAVHAINYTTKDGLPSDEIYWIMQASSGLIWIGCDAGLVSFDGVDFQAYKAPQARNKSMTGIFEDAKGRIWCHNFADQIYYVQHDSLTLFQEWEEYEGKNKLHGLSLENKMLNIRGGNSSWIISLKNKQVTKHEGHIYALGQDSLIGINNNEFYQKEGESKTILSCPDCYRYSANNEKVRYELGTFVGKDDLVIHYFHRYLGRVFFNDSGYQDSIGHEHFYLFQKKEDQFVGLSFPKALAKYGSNFIISHVEIENDSTLWLATVEGLFRWNLRDNSSEHFFKGDFITGCTLDHEHNLWVSTLDQGVFFLPSLKPKVYHFATEGQVIYHLEKDIHNNLLAGYGNGSIAYLNVEKNEILAWHQFPIKKYINNISYNKAKDEFWVTSENNTYILQTADWNIQKTIGGGGIKDIEFDTRANLVLATAAGASISLQVDHEHHVLPNIPESWKDKRLCTRVSSSYKKGYLLLDTNYTRSYTILPQEYEENYIVWVGFIDGLRYYKDGEPHSFVTKLGEKIVARDLVHGANSAIWVATLNKGLYQIKDYKETLHLTMNDGLPSNEIRQIGVYRDVLWLVTSNGLVRYNPQTNSMTVWDRNNGLPSLDILDMAFIEDKIYLTDGERLVSIPLDFESSLGSPIVDIIGFEVNDSLYPLFPTYRLRAFQNSIKIKFRGIAYKSQGAFQYKYRLHGVENSWNYTNSSNCQVNYPELSGGDYTFEVIVVTPDGLESESAIIHFSIGIPFYQKWWFIALTLMSFLLFVWWQTRIQINKARKANEEKLRRSQLERDLRISELKALKAQLNPHFIFNALNSIQDYILLNEKELASDYLGMFADLMRIYLNFSQKGWISLESEIEALKLYLELEAVRFNHKLNFNVEVDPSLDIYGFKIPTMLVQPYVENAIKHGLFYKKDHRNILVRFEVDSEDSILAIIRDNGIGRVASAKKNQQRNPKHKSFATSANNTRLQLLNFDKEQKIQAEIVDLYEDDQASGTEVRIKIPINTSF